MDQYPYVVQFSRIECLSKTGENSHHDEIYIKIWTYADPNNSSSSSSTTYFYGSPLSMNAKDDSMRHVDITLNASGLSRVQFSLYEKDNSSGDDYIGTFNIYRADAKVTSNEVYTDIWQSSGPAHYRVYWRIINKPLPALRILSLYCQKGSSGCDAAQIKRVAEVKSEVAGVTSDVLGEVKTPKAQLLSEAFKAASYAVQIKAAIEVWLKNALEGDDDVYLQHVDANQGDDAKGAFWPESGSHVKMNDDKQISFVEECGHYYRFPLDLGPVTIQVRERDAVGRDVSLGAMTIGEAEYKALNNKGAQTMILTDFLNDRNNGEGAIYHICYSVGKEDFAKPATPAGQGYTTG